MWAWIVGVATAVGKAIVAAATFVMEVVSLPWLIVIVVAVGVCFVIYYVFFR